MHKFFNIDYLKYKDYIKLQEAIQDGRVSINYLWSLDDKLLISDLKIQYESCKEFIIDLINNDPSPDDWSGYCWNGIEKDFKSNIECKYNSSRVPNLGCELLILFCGDGTVEVVSGRRKNWKDENWIEYRLVP